MSLKPAAVPLMDSGKALARSGELIIDYTSSSSSSSSRNNIYGGALSAAGASIRNAGDCLAQAAASCRFKTGTELVLDELREAATCLAEASIKLKTAVQEAKQDNNDNDNDSDNENMKESDFAQQIEALIPTVTTSGLSVEAAGAGIMQRAPLTDIGAHLVSAGEALEQTSPVLGNLGGGNDDGNGGGDNDVIELASQRMAFAGLQMKQAGQELINSVKPGGGGGSNKGPGKSWLKKR